MGAGLSVPAARAKEWEGLVNELDALCKQQRRVLDGGAAPQPGRGPRSPGMPARPSHPIQSPAVRSVQTPRDDAGSGQDLGAPKVRRQSSILKSEAEVKKIEERRKSRASVEGEQQGENVSRRDSTQSKGRRGSSVCFTGNKPPEEIEAACAAAAREGTNASAGRAGTALRSPAVASFGKQAAGAPGSAASPLSPANLVMEDGVIQPKVPEKRQNRQEMLRVRKLRKEFFQSYMEQKCESNSPILCSYFGHLCAALSYMLAARGGQFAAYPMKNRVTVEDIFFTCHLPLHYMVNSSITLAELADIAKEFVEHDPRFRDQVRVEVCHMDPVLVNGEVEQGERANETGDRGPPSLSVFRKTLEEDMQALAAIRVFCFDPFVVEQSKVTVDDTDDSDDDFSGEAVTEYKGEDKRDKTGTGPGSGTADPAAPSQTLPNECIAVYKGHGGAPKTKFGRKNRGWFSLCTDFNPVQHVVQLADAEIDTELHLTSNESPMEALYKACCTRDGFNKRYRGFIRFSLVGEQGAPPLKEEEELESRDLFIPDLYNGKGPNGILLSSCDPNVSTHIRAFAFAVHLIQGMRTDDSGVGTNCRDICRAMEFPLSVTCNFHMTLLQAFAYFQAFLAKSGLSDKMYAVAQPVEKKVDTDEAPPTMSIMDFEAVLCQLMERSPDSTQPSVLMLLCFEIGCAMNTLGLAKGTDSHWGILFSYDEEKQMCAILDIHPKKYSRIWYTSLTRIHKALVGRGYIMLYRREEDEGGLGVIDMGRQDTMIRNKMKQVTLPPSFGMQYVNSFEFPPQIMCITVYAIAFNKMKKYCMVRDLVHWLDCDPSFIVSDHHSICDLARIGNNFLNNTGWRDEWSIEVTCFDAKLDGSPRVPEATFVELLRENAKTKDSELIVQCDKAVLAEHGGGNGGEYCVVVGVHEASMRVILADVNPQIYFRHTSIPVGALYAGMCARDKVSVRSRGMITVRRAPMPRSARLDRGRELNMLKVPSAHPFKVPIANHLSAIAFAITSLGQKCSSEDVFYTAYSVLAGARYRRGSAIFPWQQLKISLHDLKERLTVAAVASMISKYQQGLGQCLRGETLVAASREEFRERLAGSIKPREPPLMMVVYRADLVHDMKLGGEDDVWRVGCGLVKDFAADTGVVTVADSNPTRHGDYWECHIDKLYDATDLADKEKEENGIVMVIEQEVAPKAAIKPGEPDPTAGESTAPQFGPAAF